MAISSEDFAELLLVMDGINERLERLERLEVTGKSDAYTITNDTTDRTYDANSTTVAELADVLATVIRDLNLGNLPST